MNVDRVISLNSELEEALKSYQQQVGEFPIEVLNEQRYALRAAIELLELAGFESLTNAHQEKAEYVEERLHHALLCAYHDLVDSLLVEFTDAVNSCVERYPAATFDAMGDRKESIMSVLNSTTDLVKESRGKSAERREYYQNIYKEHFDQLADNWRFFRQEVVPKVMETEAVLEKRIKELDREELELAKRRQWAGLLVGAAGLLAAITSLFFQ